MTATARIEQLSDSVTLYLGDCREIVGRLNDIDAVVSDPPYGMAWNTDSTRFSGGDPTRNNRRRGHGKATWGTITADDVPFDPSPWLAYPEVILWGANHYAERLPRGTTLVWAKKGTAAWGTFLSDAEIGWQSGGHGVYCKHVEFQGGLARKAEHDGLQAAHPTQKPIALMEWCIGRLRGGASRPRPFHGVGHDRRRCGSAGTCLRRHRDRAQALRHGLPSHRAGAGAAAPICGIRTRLRARGA